MCHIANAVLLLDRNSSLYDKTFCLVWNLVQSQTYSHTESDAYEPTVHTHRWAQKYMYTILAQYIFLFQEVSTSLGRPLRNFRDEISKMSRTSSARGSAYHLEWENEWCYSDAFSFLSVWCLRRWFLWYPTIFLLWKSHVSSNIWQPTMSKTCISHRLYLCTLKFGSKISPV